MLVSTERCNFANGMKKLMNIILSLTLSLILFVTGSGITFHHCNCSGKTTFVLAQTPQKDAQQHPEKNGCMTVQSVSMSPTTQMQPAAFNFHTFLPLVAIVNDWSNQNILPQTVKVTYQLFDWLEYTTPPHEQLNKLCVLLI